MYDFSVLIVTMNFFMANCIRDNEREGERIKKRKKVKRTCYGPTHVYAHAHHSVYY